MRRHNARQRKADKERVIEGRMSFILAKPPMVFKPWPKAKRKEVK